jgi:hypothetical protein
MCCSTTGVSPCLVSCLWDHSLDVPHYYNLSILPIAAAFKKKSPVPFHLTSEELDLIFKFVDLDYSGSISYKEYQEAIRRKGGS